MFGEGGEIIHKIYIIYTSRNFMVGISERLGRNNTEVRKNLRMARVHIGEADTLMDTYLLSRGGNSSYHYLITAEKHLILAENFGMKPVSHYHRLSELREDCKKIHPDCPLN